MLSNIERISPKLSIHTDLDENAGTPKKVFLINNQNPLYVESIVCNIPLLCLAARDNECRLIRSLLHTHNPNVIDIDDCTPLYFASSFGQLEAVKLLLTHPNADPNLASLAGLTPLHLAVYGGYRDIVEYLLCDSRIDPHIKNDDGYSPLALAAKQNKVEIVRTFLHKEIQCYKQGSPDLESVTRDIAFLQSVREEQAAKMIMLEYTHLITEANQLSNYPSSSYLFSTKNIEPVVGSKRAANDELDRKMKK
jgi:ankyrin repeat protein